MRTVKFWILVLPQAQVGRRGKLPHETVTVYRTKAAARKDKWSDQIMVQMTGSYQPTVDGQQK